MIYVVLENIESVKFWFDAAPTGADKIIDANRNRAISRLQRNLVQLHGTDFTAALDLIKEVFGSRAYEVSGYANF